MMDPFAGNNVCIIWIYGVTELNCIYDDFMAVHSCLILLLYKLMAFILFFYCRWWSWSMEFETY